MLLTRENIRCWNNQWVRVNRGGPDSHYGRLIAVQDDYLVLRADDQEIYCQTRHVKSITADSFLHACSSDQDENQVSLLRNEMTFRDLLKKMIYRRVMIHGSEPENIGGILVHLQDGDIVLVHDHEVMFVPIIHIKTVRRDLNKANASNNDSANEKDGRETEDAMKEMAEGHVTTFAESTVDGNVESTLRQTRIDVEYPTNLPKYEGEFNPFSKRTFLGFKRKRRRESIVYLPLRRKKNQRRKVGFPKTWHPMVWLAEFVQGDAKIRERRRVS